MAASRWRPGVSIGRVDPLLQPMNLAVPGHGVQDALTTRPDPSFDDLTDFVLGLPGLLQGISRSQVEWAEALNPSVVFLWLGSNDVLVEALSAGVLSATPADQFALAHGEVMRRLHATGARLVVANVPDVTTIPYLTSGPELALQLALSPVLVEALLGVGEGDFIIPNAFPMIAPILTGQAAGPLPPEVVFDAGEVATARAVTDVYNTTIAMQADVFGAVLVDVQRTLSEIDAHGLVIGDRHLTTAFLGGLFSLDGIHPTDTGYAVLANAFIDALNEQAAARIPRVDLVSVANGDPLVFPASSPSPGVRVPAHTADLHELLVH